MAENEAGEARYSTASTHDASHATRASGGSVRRSTGLAGGYVTVETVSIWVAYILMVACNAAFEVGRLGGVSSADVAYSVYTWFVPAGYVFSIWTLIYIGLAVWLIWYTRQAPSRRSDGFTTVSSLFIVSCALNVVWLALWHFQMMALSLVVIVALWFVLGAMYLKLRRPSKGEPSMFGWVPVSLYVSWITVATVSNFAIGVTWATDGGSLVANEASAVMLSALVLAVGVVLCWWFRDIVIPAVFVWAIIGVGVHVAVANIVIAGLVFVMAFIAAVAAIVVFLLTEPSRNDARMWR